MNGRRYVIAIRPDKKAEAPTDWQRRLGGIDGVVIEGATENRAQFLARPETMLKVKSLFGAWCRIEETVGREPL